MGPTIADTSVARRVEELTGHIVSGPLRIYDDTSNYMAIDRDDLLLLGGETFVVTLTEKEKRFGLAGEPKFWVKRAVSLDTGRTHIVKMVFEEVFRARVGDLEVVCRRDPAKEAAVLELFRGDPRIMDGRSLRDAAGNIVRILDFIRGKDFIAWLLAQPGDHTTYFREQFPSVMVRIIDCLDAIAAVHAAGLTHGDIRNDHIFVEDGTGAFRWIDFDVAEDTPEYDLRSVGNILHFVVGRGFVVFRDAVAERPELAEVLGEGDASEFFPNRVMNLRAVYPIVPARLNDLLLRFSRGATVRPASVAAVVDELRACARAEGWPLPARR